MFFYFMKFSKIEILGFISTWAILVGYLLIKLEIILPTGLLYQSINLFGSFGIVFVSFKRKAKQPMILNIVWMAVALFAIGRLFI